MITKCGHFGSVQGGVTCGVLVKCRSSELTRAARVPYSWHSAEIFVVEPKPALLSPAEYLEREEKNPVKCEYVDGEVYAMSGAKRRHNLIASNLVHRAREAANSREGCQVFGSDMKVYVETYNSFYYPDLSVCCDRSDRNELFLVRPCFIV